MTIRPSALFCSLLLAPWLQGCAHQPTPSRQPGPEEVLRMRMELAEQLVKQGEHDNATPLLKDLAHRQPENHRVHLLLGIVLREKGVLGAAEQEIREAIRLQQRDPEAHTALGALLLRRKRRAEAEKSHRMAVSLAPGVARYHNDLGFCLLVQRKLDQAKQELNVAIRLDPTLRLAFNNLGFALGLQGDLASAQKAFAQAGSPAMVLTNLGYLAELRGRPGRARQYYEKALRKQPDYAPALHNLKIVDPGRYGARADEGDKRDDAEVLETEVEDGKGKKSGGGAERDAMDRPGSARSRPGGRRMLQGAPHRFLHR